jgi:Flp pilus assembly pilin Flp
MPPKHDDGSETAVFYATMLIFGSVALVAFVYAIVDTITLLELP